MHDGPDLLAGNHRGSIAELAGEPFTWYTEADGLASNHTSRVLEDQRGDLRILASKASHSALTRWRRSDEAFDRFTSIDGLPALGEPMDLSSRSREIVWSMNPRFDDLDSFVVRLRETAGEILDDRGIAWQLDAPPPGKRIPLRPEVRQHLLLVYKESLLNIVRHAAASQVSLSLRLSGGRLLGEICDDGTGFDLDSLPRHSGSGLRNIQSRVAELGGRAELSSSTGKGTIVRFELAI